MPRRLDPDDVLGNPQRAMMYGWLKANGSANLLGLSTQFAVRSSTVLWHMRKLEAGGLVRSDKVNGLRVFYATAGGAPVRDLGRARALLRNPLARAVFEAVAAGRRSVSDLVGLPFDASSVRWHLRKLRDGGLLAEAPAGRARRYTPTELGRRAFAGAPLERSQAVPPMAAGQHPLPT